MGMGSVVLGLGLRIEGALYFDGNFGYGQAWKSVHGIHSETVLLVEDLDLASYDR